MRAWRCPAGLPRFVWRWPCFLGGGLWLGQTIIRLGKGRHVWCGFAGFWRCFLRVGLLLRRRGRRCLRGRIASACIGRMGADHTCGRRWLGENHFYRRGLAGLGGARLPMVGGLIQQCSEQQKMRKGRCGQNWAQSGVCVHIPADNGGGCPPDWPPRRFGHGGEGE